MIPNLEFTNAHKNADGMILKTFHPEGHINAIFECSKSTTGPSPVNTASISGNDGEGAGGSYCRVLDMVHYTRPKTNMVMQ